MKSAMSGIASLPWLLLAAAVIAGTSYLAVDAIMGQQISAGLFAVFLGSSLGAWGYVDIAAGSIRGKSRRISRATQPFVFWPYVTLARLVPCAVLVPFGIVHCVFGPARFGAF